MPTNDPTLEVEWSMDGRPLSNSSRMKVISDFGFAMLDISSADSRDSGKYTCAIRNRSNTTHITLRFEFASCDLGLSDLAGMPRAAN